MRVPVNEPCLGEKEKRYLLECIESGWVSSDGPMVKLFEDNFSSYIGCEFGVAVSSGTAALDVVIDFLDLQPGDEVLMPTFTIISVVSQVLKSGATPVFVDCDDTWNMDVKLVSDLVSERTKAIIMVHTYSHPVDADPILELCREKGIFCIEDAAEMHGQYYKDRKCGSLSDVSIFSFYPNKHITTGEGGMVVTSRRDVAAHARAARNLFFGEPRYIHERLGWNYRMTNMQGALGCAQLESIDDFVLRKREVGKIYRQAFAGIEGVSMQPAKTNYSTAIDWVFGLELTDNRRGQRDDICEDLNKRGIGTRNFFYPLHKQPIVIELTQRDDIVLPRSERAAANGFYLPSGLSLAEREQDYVINHVLEVLNERL